MATKQYAEFLLRELPEYAGYSKAQMGQLLDEMPAIALNRLEHRATDATKPVSSFHDFLKIKMRGDLPGNKASEVLKNLREAYESWDTTNGARMWAIAREWLTAKGVP